MRAPLRSYFQAAGAVVIGGILFFAVVGALLQLAGLA